MRLACLTHFVGMTAKPNKAYNAHLGELNQARSSLKAIATKHNGAD